MGKVVKNNILARIKSERGASLSVALLLILVCVAISASVLAASTAAVGRFAERGSADQRYYSAISAAGLFKDSLGEDGELTLVFEQQRSGKRDARTGADVTWDGSVSLSGSGSGVVDDGSAGKGYNFLPNITSQALFGVNAGSFPNQPASAGWVTPFSKTSLESGKDYKQFEYTIAGVGDPLSGKNLSVDVKARLHNDSGMTLELDFANKLDSAGQPAEASSEYHAYMVFAADVKQDDSRSETLGDTIVSGSDVSSTVDVAETRKTTVTWRLQQFVPGRGFSS